MESLTYVEIDIPFCVLIYGTAPCAASIPTTGAIKCFNTIKTCQDRANFDETEVTLRFAKDALYLPREIECFPNILDISFTPAAISLGENLGTRATLSVTFKDHQHTDTGEGFDKYLSDRDYNPWDQGTFWGKFRARQPFLRGRSIRWITGLVGQELAEMETRHFVLESFDGPTPDGKYTLIAKDVLKLVDGDRAQAPVMNTGFLVSPITDSATTATLSPAGIGDEEYPIEGHLALGGKEIVAFTRWLYDPEGENDPFTKIMLHMDGSNGGTSFADSNSGGSARTWTASGATTSTSSPKFGTASFLSTVSQQYITTPYTADLALSASGDWTLDFWMKSTFSLPTGQNQIMGNGSGSSTNSIRVFGINVSGTITIEARDSGGTAKQVTSVASVYDGNWHHIAGVRRSNMLYLYVDGVSVGTPVAITSSYVTTTNWSVGRDGSNGASQSYLGRVDEFRFSNGVARWSANFTPPAAPYAVTADQITTEDVLTLTARGQMGTTAQAHAAQDRVQLVLTYASDDVSDIIYDLMVNYADVPAEFITLTDWQAETETFLARLYSANICEPTSVGTLISELILQGCLSIWWDDVAQKIRLQVLRSIVTEAARFSPDNTIEGTLTIKEQPEKRLSRIQTRFGQINPLKQISDNDNYRSSSLVIDADAEADYGGIVIKTVNSRWIPALGRTVADRFGTIQLARFRDPPRRLTFDLSRYAGTDAVLGGGYRVASHSLQDDTGALIDLPVQVTRLNAPADRFKVEAEEVNFALSDEDLSTRSIIIDADIMNVNLRAAHDAIYPEAESGDVVVCRILEGVKVGSVSSTLIAFDVGDWPVGVFIEIILQGKVQGAGGAGGRGHLFVGAFNEDGAPGGVALYTRHPVDIEFPAGAKLWSGGGGGGGGDAFVYDGKVGGGGGGGAGLSGGLGGPNDGNPGTEDAGGTGGGGYIGAPGGAGGGPGLPGGSGPFINYNGTDGGLPGSAIDGVSYVTFSITGGDIRGPQIS